MTLRTHSHLLTKKVGQTNIFLCYVCNSIIMLKNINIRDIPEPLYYEVLQLKAKLRAKNWVDFLEKTVKKLKEKP